VTRGVPVGALLALVATCAPAVAVAQPAPRDPKADRLAWRAELGQALRFKITDGLPPDGPVLKLDPSFVPAGPPLPAHLIHGHTLGATGEACEEFDRLWLPLALALQLPDAVAKDGRGYAMARRHASVLDVRPFVVQLAGKVTGTARRGDAGVRVLEHKASLADDSSGKDPGKYRMAGGTWVAKLHYDPVRGAVVWGQVAAAWTLESTASPPANPIREKFAFAFELDLHLEAKDPRLDGLVATAIEQGVIYLKAKQTPAGVWDTPDAKGYPAGQAAFGALALMASGVPPTDPTVQKPLDFALAKPFDKTYSTAIALMALEARHAPTPDALAAMGPADQKRAWDAIPAKLTAAERTFAKAAAAWLVENADTERRWGYPLRTATYRYDNSCSQYAVLGLLAADRLGERIPAAAWERFAQHWISDQDTAGPTQESKRATGPGGSVAPELARERGWAYRREGPGAGGATGSMTCAGLASLSITRAQLQAMQALSPKLGAKIDEGLRDGRAWLARHYEIADHPGNSGAWIYYYLYGLERAGILAGFTHVAEHDWYREGAAWLCSTWVAGRAWNDNVNDTAFALLFLKRATRPLVTLSD